MYARTAYLEDPDVREVVVTDHCLARFRSRGPYRKAGGEEALAAVVAVLQDECHVARIPPSWAMGGRGARRWAASRDLAFPLEPSGEPGRWVATTVLRRGR